MRTLFVGVWLVAMPGLAASAWASDNAGYKLGRGAVNATLGFLSYPAHAEACSQQGWENSVVVDVGCSLKALVPTIGQHVLGIVEVLTFPIPFPWPNYASPYPSPGDLPWERAGRYRPNRTNPPIP